MLGDSKYRKSLRNWVGKHDLFYAPNIQREVTGSIDGALADGSRVEISTYQCQLNWFANSGQTPLLGVGLLLAKELRVDYTNLELTLELKAKRDTP